MTTTRLLYADNDEDFRTSFVSDVLEPAGYEVLHASGPEEARRILTAHLIHLAIVDVRLSNDDDRNDESGLTLCESMDPTVARIILTGFAEDDWRRVRKALLSEGKLDRVADGFISKRENSYHQEMLDEISRVLRTEFEIIPDRRFAVLTSGGDSPGMNAAIWGVVRTAMINGVEVIGVHDGYRGLVENEMHKLRWNEVSNIMGLSGTILGTARYDSFRDPKVRQKALDNIFAKHISGLIVIGGDGSMQGARALAQDAAAQGKALHTIALPGTIDNDLWGADLSLGATTAADAMIANLRNMATSGQAFRRIFVGEVMGACAGYLALQVAVGIGADAVFTPEQTIVIDPPTSTKDQRPWRERVSYVDTRAQLDAQLAQLTQRLEAGFLAGKRSAFVIVAEGISKLTAKEHSKKRWVQEYVQEYLEDRIKNWPVQLRPDVRIQELGYPPRGAPPSSFDVWLGARSGAEAVQCLLDGKMNVMVGWSEDLGIVETPFDEVIEKSKRSPREIWGDHPKWQELLKLQQTLACPPNPIALREALRQQGNCFIR